MDEMAGIVEACFGETIRETTRLLDRNGEHFLLCGLDPEVLLIVLGLVRTYAERMNRTVVQVLPTTPKDENPGGKVFFIDIDGEMPMSRQLHVYHYLEKTRRHPCCLVLVSSSCTSLDRLERRVKSRFNHRVFFLGFLPLGSYKILYRKLTGADDEEDVQRQYTVNPSISELSKRAIMKKYRILEYSTETLYALLNPVHIALVLMAFRKRIKYINCVSEFRAFTSSVNELKGTTSMEILLYFLDILDFGLIDKEGALLVDACSFKRHVSSVRPLYLKSLMHKST
ncbi:hypothetical protein M970_031010 [Encephalitozoon cuniculi EcunIII-L]|uniref:Origin recognition complex subunit 2 n=1 Tax=Encephalitozoon cuniculi TaxID=6035 RepID=M1K9J5_ENCCN|nr:hypothetical protein ECU03_1090 [Encephalitozoon cuniculi]KMV66471.1 hypothetical protein M970_031010 [Encephalitozoon cuniculi EcunIII-L]